MKTMNNSGISSKEQILTRIRNAYLPITTPSIDWDSDVYVPLKDKLQQFTEEEAEETDLENLGIFVFVAEFDELGGEFIYCESEEDAEQMFGEKIKACNWKKVACLDNRLAEMARLFSCEVEDVQKDTPKDAVVIPCEALIARTGGIVLSSKTLQQMNVVQAAENLVVLATPEQVVPDMEKAMALLTEKYNKKDIPAFVNVLTGVQREENAAGDYVELEDGTQKHICVLFIDRQ